METSNINGTSDMPRVYQLRKPEPRTIHLPNLTPPPRGTRGAVRIGELLAPLQCIVEHPDRNRILADFVRQCDAE